MMDNIMMMEQMMTKMKENPEMHKQMMHNMMETMKENPEMMEEMMREKFLKLILLKLQRVL